ncbi:DUF711 family protein [Candidatus Woesearchaeota archaeon]|nr:DUF711 family protein [Candidatus Woesearchaeota archaeon]
MIIRTITTGINLNSYKDTVKIREAAKLNQKIKESLEKEGYEVQTSRISTNSWKHWLKGLSEKGILTEIRKLDELCKNINVSFFNIGFASGYRDISTSPFIIRNTSFVFCSAKIADPKKGIMFENVKAAAQAIKRISEETENGYGNFRFCASANCGPGIPFFPASYHEGKKASFAIGLECGDLLMAAFSKSKNLSQAQANFKKTFSFELKKVEKAAEKISRKLKTAYDGIDASIAPSLSEAESVAFAYEKLGFGKFGEAGTLSISAMITKILKELPLKTCGYSGLMFPVCEDFGLARRASEGTYSVKDLLLNSAVCGCGLDTVPIPGDVSPEKIEALLLDVASLSIKLNKPLSARLFPVPGKKAGQMTSFNSPYLIDCKVMDV